MDTGDHTLSALEAVTLSKTVAEEKAEPLVDALANMLVKV